MSRIHVIMPARNAERFIAEAIESVRAQTLADWTLHISDDGSTDRTPEIARRFAGQDSRIRFSMRANRGIAHVMNDAIAQTDTELIACMHADDVMLPQRLMRQLQAAEAHPRVAVFSSLVEWIDPSGRTLGHSHSDLTTPEAVDRTLAAGACVAFPHPAVLFRRSAVLSGGGYRQDFFPAEDTELWNRLALAGHGVLVLPEVLLRYRVHPASASTSKAALMIRKLRWMEQCLAARREGRDEPGWEQFLAERAGLSFLSRVGQWRRDCSRTLYQCAIAHYAARDYLRLLPALLAAAVLEPEVVLRRIRHRI